MVRLSRVIHKHEVRLGEPLELDLPAGAEVVKFAEQPLPGRAGLRPPGASTLRIWVLFDPAAPAAPASRSFRVYATGEPVFDGDEHIESLVDSEGYVWHLFEEARS